MPDTVAPSQAVIPDGASPEQVFAAFQAIDPALAQTAASGETPAAPPAAPEPEKPKPAETKPTPTANADAIPEQFLTGKKEEPKQEDEFETLMKTEPQGQLKHDDWKRYKSAVSRKIDALNAQIKEREEKLAAAEKRGVPEDIAKKLETYEKTLAEREAILERIAVQESPKFKEKFVSRETAIGERLKKHGTELGLDVEALDLALKSSPKRRAEILDQMDMGETARSSLAGLMNQFDLLQDEKSDFLSQSKEVHAKWQEEEKAAEAEKERQWSAQVEQVFHRVGEEMSEKLFAFQKVEGNPTWNGWVDEAKAEAKKYYSDSQLKYDEMAKVAYRAAASFLQDKIITALKERNDAVEKENASLKRSQPGASGHVPHSNGAPDDKHLTPEQRAMETWNRIVAR